MKYVPIAALCLFVSLICFAQSSPAQSGASAQTPGNEFFYTANFGDDTISGFALDLTSGKATQVPGSPFSTGVGPGPITHSPDGRFLYVALTEQPLGGPCGSNPAQLVSYSINPASGSLQQVDDVTTPDFCASDIAVDPSGKFVYVALDIFTNVHGGAIAAYKTSSGHLTAVEGSPFASPITVSSGQQPAMGGLAISTDGKVLYASDPNDADGILIFDRDTSTGALTFRGAFNTGVNLEPIAISPSGKFLVAMAPLQFGSPGNGVYEYEIGINGDLKAVPGSPFPGQGTSTANVIRVSPNGKFVAFAGFGIGVLRQTSSDGALSSVPGSPFGSGLAFALAFDPSGHFVLGPSTIFAINSQTGVLTQTGSFASGNLPEGITAVLAPPACTASSDFTVNICSPGENAKVESPVNVVAAAKSTAHITSMQIYVDFKKVFHSPDASEIDTDVSMSKGTHFITVKAWDNTGRDFSSSRTITVE